MTFLLKKPYNMYTKQLESHKLRIALEKLLSIIGLERDQSNKGQFDLRVINIKSSMLLDKTTINALQIFSKEMEKKIKTKKKRLWMRRKKKLQEEEVDNSSNNINVK